MEFAQQLERARRAFFVRAGGGVGLPAAGLLYWAALAVAGMVLTTKAWGAVACIGSGLIYPLGLLLARPTRSNVAIKDDPLSPLALRGIVAINLLWPLHFAIWFTAPQLLPLSLAIGMALHWPIIGWMYDCRACLAHALMRVPLVSAIWFLLPGYRLTLLPLAVALVYAVTIVQIRRELGAASASAAPQPA